MHPQSSTITTDRTWKQPGYSLTGECYQLWYMDMMEYLSAIKRNTFESVLMRWMNLEPIIQSEVTQKEKNKDRILTHVILISTSRTNDGTNEPICRAAMEM